MLLAARIHAANRGLARRGVCLCCNLEGWRCIYVAINCCSTCTAADAGLLTLFTRLPWYKSRPLLFPSHTLPADADYQDYNNQLRHGILDAYSGIVQGLGPQKCSQYLRNEVSAVVEFVSSVGIEVTETSEPDDDVAKAAVNLLGDICSCMQDMAATLKNCPRKEWEQLLNHARQSEMLQTETEWAVQQIDHALLA